MFIYSLGELAPRAEDAQSLGACPLSDYVPCSIPPGVLGPLHASCPWNPLPTGDACLPVFQGTSFSSGRFTQKLGWFTAFQPRVINLAKYIRKFNLR